ncbi:hypothetical protein POM88_002112 [Heracleum sosnowskyi]|uniref:Replication factor A C-terminal domain-containing protein n=1 Tax=Heracleum sosnowskyi TaxID=360622 RepID=A0AAD8JHE3_9APIA|nr:hypothetical protein POM88_002112 [Heracleum sosnowskyi]
MATYKFLKDLTIGHDKGSIKVRVSRDWDGRKTNSTYVSKKNYLLIDEEGTQIQAVASEYSLIALFKKQVETGKIYMFSDYIVAKAADTYRPISGEYVINFNRQTKIDALDDIPTISRYKFEIETFEAARTKEGDVVTLMDVVGKLTKYTPIQTTNNGKRNVEIALTNERNETMKITLWENQAHDFLQLRTEYHEKPNIYVIVTSTTTKLVSEEHVLWSSSSTQLYFNIDHPTILALRTNSNMQADLVPENVPSLTRQIKTTTEEVEKVTIQQLFDAQLPVGKDAIAFFTEATVVAILPGCDWYYMGCSKCSKIVNEVQQCSNCPNNKVPPIPIYRVTVEVEDATSVTTFVLFDRDVKKIINVSAQHILNNDKDASQEMIPPILNNMLGKTYIFKLRLTSYNTIKKREGFTVTQIEEVQATNFNNAQPQVVILDEQVDNDNGQNSKDDLENKRETPEEQNGDPQPPPSSVTKPMVGKQNRNKRQK